MFACKSAGYTLQLGLVPQDSAKAEVPFLPPNQCRLNDKFIANFAFALQRKLSDNL